MPRHSTLLAASTFTALLAACSEPGPNGPLEPTAPSAAKAEESVHRIEIHDACDPTTFAAVGCSRSGGVKFDQFIAELTRNGSVGAWHFAPGHVEAKVGQVLLAINRGGETHTFTEVEDFGGGIVPLLNQLSGNTTVAPECMALAADDFIPPGGFDDDDEVEAPGTEKYQCCIHPWMRTTVTARR